MITYILFKIQACSSQQQLGRSSQMLTYILFKPRHGLVSNKQERPARCWLTAWSKHRPFPCHQQAGRTSEVLTYILFKTQSIYLSATIKKSQSYADLQAVENQSMHLSSRRREGQICWLTSCSKPKACCCQQQAERSSQILTYILSKIQRMLLSATSRVGQPDADLHPVQITEHGLVNNKQEGATKCWLTDFSKSRTSSCQ